MKPVKTTPIRLGAPTGRQHLENMLHKSLEHFKRQMIENSATPLFIDYDLASRGGDQSAVAVFSAHGESLYEECLATQGADEPTVCSSKSLEYWDDKTSSWRPANTKVLDALGELESANRTIIVLREGIDKANAEIMRLRDELARRPASFVEPEPDKPNPFRDFTTDRRRMGPL